MDINVKRMLRHIEYYSVVLVFIGSTVTTLASDLEREKRLEDQTLAALFTGEPVYLSTPGHEFLALETEAEGDTKGAVVLLHGRGYGPDSEIVVGPLRETLAEDGWHTLSIQMPVLEKGAKYYDYIEVFPDARLRITAALEHLKTSEFSPIIIIAHSCGVHMSMDWLRHNGDDAIDAYVGLGMGATDYKQPMQVPFPFAQLSIPILDVYGDADYPAVVSKADERLQQFQHTSNKSKQVAIAQANHEFADHTDALIETVSQWLDTL